jgi:hypothetical protein
MWKFAAALLTLLLAATALADDTPARLSKDELLSLLPGAKVTHINQGGSERHWTNAPDGTLVASTNNKIIGNALGTQVAQGRGTWHVNDEGKFCVDIDWRRVQEKWCSFILRGEGDTYYLNVVDDKRKIVFAK